MAIPCLRNILGILSRKIFNFNADCKVTLNLKDPYFNNYEVFIPLYWLDLAEYVLAGMFYRKAN